MLPQKTTIVLRTIACACLSHDYRPITAHQRQANIFGERVPPNIRKALFAFIGSSCDCNNQLHEHLGEL